MTIVRAVIAVLFVVGCGSPRASGPDDAVPPPPPPPPPVDAGQPAPRGPTAWSWDLTPDLFPRVDLAVERAGARYVLALAPGHDGDRQRPVVLRGDTWSLEISRGGELAGAAIAIDDARVYVATYNRISAGCELAAIAIATGKPLWSLRLAGIGPIAHSKYSNRVQLRLVGGHPVVFGREARRYIEERDRATGALRSHQLLPPEPVAPPIAESLYRELDQVLASRPEYAVSVGDFLARHVAMADADHAARRAAFRVAVRQLDGLPIQRGRYKLAVELVETAGDLTVRAKRS